MTSIREVIKRRFSQASPLRPGIYHYKSPEFADRQYRMHLRIEGDGEGLLILDASTILHLNQSATEYAYHIVNSTSTDIAIKTMANRYDIGIDRIKNDFVDFRDRIFSLIDTPDLDPIHFLDLERDTPYSTSISAPYRIDCALTYKIPESSSELYTPIKRVDRELSTQEWKTIISKTWDAGVPHIVFTGGEPTLREDLLELIDFAESNGQVTGLLTDGIALSNPDFLHGLLQSGLDHLMIVFNPKNDLAWTALEYVLPEDIHTTVHFTISPGEIDLITSSLEKLSDLGVNAISLSSISPEFDEDLRKARDHVAELNLPFVWDLPVPYSARNPIALETIDEGLEEGAGKAWLYIEPDGDILPAQGINQVLGNLVSDNWEEIWK